MLKLKNLFNVFVTPSMPKIYDVDQKVTSADATKGK